jgi:hypothetical protein
VEIHALRKQGGRCRRSLVMSATTARPSRAYLRSIHPVVGLGLRDGELAEVENLTARTSEQTQGAVIRDVVRDREVALGECLVAALAFTGVVKASVVGPAVVVTVLLANRRIGEEEHVRRLGRWSDAPLSSPAEAGVEVSTADRVAGAEIPSHGRWPWNEATGMPRRIHPASGLSSGPPTASSARRSRFSQLAPARQLRHPWRRAPMGSPNNAGRSATSSSPNHTRGPPSRPHDRDDAALPRDPLHLEDVESFDPETKVTGPPRSRRVCWRGVDHDHIDPQAAARPQEAAKTRSTSRSVEHTDRSVLPR